MTKISQKKILPENHKNTIKDLYVLVIKTRKQMPTVCHCNGGQHRGPYVEEGCPAEPAVGVQLEVSHLIDSLPTEVDGRDASMNLG